WLDLTACNPVKVEPPTPLNTEGLTAMLIVNRAPVYECLLDARRRGGAAETSVAIETTVTDAGAQHKVSGENIKPEAQKCIEDAFGKLAIPPLARGAAPVLGKAQFIHSSVSPSVAMGKNEASDVVGAIRLAE